MIGALVFRIVPDLCRIAILAAVWLTFGTGFARAQDRVYNDPSLVGARVTFDPAIWRMSPPNPNNGILLTCIADGCRPEPFPMSARCEMTFRVKGNPDGRKDTAAHLRRIDQAAWLRMQAVFMAVPLRWCADLRTRATRRARRAAGDVCQARAASPR